MEQDKVLQVLKSVEILPIDYLQSNNIECEYQREFKIFHPVMGWVQVESYYLPKYDLYKWQLIYKYFMIHELFELMRYLYITEPLKDSQRVLRRL